MFLFRNRKFRRTMHENDNEECKTPSVLESAISGPFCFQQNPITELYNSASSPTNPHSLTVRREVMRRRRGKPRSRCGRGVGGSGGQGGGGVRGRRLQRCQGAERGILGGCRRRLWAGGGGGGRRRRRRRRGRLVMMVPVVSVAVMVLRIVQQVSLRLRSR